MAKGYYSEIAGGYDKLYRDEQLKKLKVLEIAFHPKPLLLDLGCGTGIAMEFFKVKSVGIDPAFGMLKKAKGMRVCASAEYLPFKGKAFKSVIALTSIHNFKDITKAVREIKRVCALNSQIACTVLKKSAKCKELVQELCKNFDFNIVEEEKDIILVKDIK